MRDHTPYPDEQRADDGFIVVAVLWIIGALATLATIYAIYVIDSAVSFAVYDQRLKSDSLFAASAELTAAQIASQEGTPTRGHFVFRLGDADVVVDYISENARIDLNAAPREVLAGLFTTLGARAELAATYADNVLAWRSIPPEGRPDPAAAYRTAGLPYSPRGAPFPHPSELALVAGIPEALVDRAMPFVTVYSGVPQIDILDAAPEVLAALPGMNPALLHTVLAQRQADPQNAQRLAALLGPAAPLATTQGSKAVRVMPRIRFDDGTRMSADIVIFLLDSGNEPYRVLSWRDSSDDPADAQRVGAR